MRYVLELWHFVSLWKWWFGSEGNSREPFPTCSFPIPNLLILKNSQELIFQIQGIPVVITVKGSSLEMNSHSQTKMGVFISAVHFSELLLLETTFYVLGLLSYTFAHSVVSPLAFPADSSWEIFIMHVDLQAWEKSLILGSSEIFRTNVGRGMSWLNCLLIGIVLQIICHGK